jgi:hemoglobin
MKKDIRDIEDIKLLVDTFYNKVSEDGLLGPIFNDVAKVDWSKHLPIMYNFWNSILFGAQGYKGNPMDAHFRLDKKRHLEGNDFNTWKTIFMETIDELFEGEIADSAKKKAVSIADLMFFKLQNHEQSAGVNIGKIRR